MPIFSKSKSALGRKGLQRLDFLLLAVESLDLNGPQAMLWTSRKLGLHEDLSNGVDLWKLRICNPLRRSSRSGEISYQQSEALISLLCEMSERIYPQIHQLLSSREPQSINNERWNFFHTRLRDLIEERMNKERHSVKRLLQGKHSFQFSKNLLISLALSAGPGGVDRLRASLLDPV